MPRIIYPKIYSATFDASNAIMRDQVGRQWLNQFRLKLDTGFPLYRYVGYRDFRGQQERASRTIWGNLNDDLSNRWSGMGSDVSLSARALYMSADGPDPAKDTRFPELDYYQDSTLPPTQEVSYFKYETNKEPVWQKVQAGSLRSMFLFFTNRGLNGLNLQYSVAKTLFDQILVEARKRDPAAFPKDATAKSLLMASDDASFSRAIGNVVLLQPDIDFFHATSVRDGESINVIVKGKSGETLAMLDPAGRATVMVNDEGRKGIGVYTIDDLIYNRDLERDTGGIIAPKKDLVGELQQFEKRVSKMDSGFSWNFAGDAIESTVAGEVKHELSLQENPYDTRVDQLVTSLNIEALRGRVKAQLENFVTASAHAATRDYHALLQSVGQEGLNSLLNSKVVDPRYSKIITANGTDPSYLTTIIEKTVLESKAHYLNQEASNIQSKLASATQISQKTSAELDSRRHDLQQVESELAKQPNDQPLKDQRKQIEKWIAEIEAQAREAQADEQRYENERYKNEESKDETNRDKQEAETRWKEQRTHAFEGEGL